jgi:lysophospholipase L1-like esterase
MSWRRFVALGDSFTEGIGDRVDGIPLLPWPTWLTAALDAGHDGFQHVNLAHRGLRAAQVRETQLAPALTMCPDLVSVIAGGNDVMGLGWDAGRVRDDLSTMIGALVARGALVITGTVPDFTAVARGERSRQRLRARLEECNAMIRDLSRRHDTILVDFWARSQPYGRTIWSADNIHPNAYGHLLIARDIAGALHERTGVSIAGPAWTVLDSASRRRELALAS